MPGPTQTTSKRSAPRWGVLFFSLGIPLAIWSMLTTFAAAMGMFPIYDLTPALVLGAALLTRRWDGVSARWVGVASVLAGIMALQWIPWYVWMTGDIWPGTDVLNVLTSVYAAELLLLVILVVVVSTLSIRGIRKVALVDVLSVES